MREVVLLFFFIFSFLLIMWVMYIFLISDRKIERRINTFFDIDKSRKKKRERIKINTESIRKINDILRDRLSQINQEKTEQLLKSAGVALNPEEYIMLKWFLSAITGGISYLLSDNLFFLIPGGVVGYIAPGFWLGRKIGIRIHKFNERLPDMISTIIGSLKSGYSLSHALKTVVEECDSPVKDEVEFLLKEMNYGITMEDALNNLNKRMPSGDLELMIQAILIQRQVGGNLATVLEAIVGTIRDRNRIQRQVRTLTSQGRLSGRIIGGLPIALGLMIYVINPQYIKILFSNTIGIVVMVIAFISGIAGFILINKLTRVEV